MFISQAELGKTVEQKKRSVEETKSKVQLSNFEQKDKQKSRLDTKPGCELSFNASVVEVNFIYIFNFFF